MNFCGDGVMRTVCAVMSCGERDVMRSGGDGDGGDDGGAGGDDQPTVRG